MSTKKQTKSTRAKETPPSSPLQKQLCNRDLAHEPCIYSHMEYKTYRYAYVWVAGNYKPYESSQIRKAYIQSNESHRRTGYQAIDGQINPETKRFRIPKKNDGKGKRTSVEWGIRLEGECGLLINEDLGVMERNA